MARVDTGHRGCVSDSSITTDALLRSPNMLRVRCESLMLSIESGMIELVRQLLV